MTWAVRLLLRCPLLIATMPVVAFGGSFQIGIQITVLNAPSRFIKELVNQTCAERYGLILEHSQLSLIWSFTVSIFCIGGLLGAQCAGRLANKYGRKRCLLLNNLVAISAAILMVLSKTAMSFEMIMVGRFLYGINAGIGMLTHSMYVIECAPKRLRTMMGVSIAIFVSWGRFTGQLLGLRELLGTEDRWPWLLACGAYSGLIQMLTLPLLPESPRYLLLMRGDRQACENAIARLWGHGQDHTSEIEDMLAEGAAMERVRVQGLKELLTEPSVRWQLLTIVVTASSLQLSGINAVFFYAFDLLNEAGIKSSMLPYASLGTSVCDVIGVTISSLVIEYVGKKMMLSIGYFIMAIAHALITLTMYLKTHLSWMPYLSMVCVFIFIMAFSGGPSATTAPLAGEIFDQSFKASAFTVGSTLIWTWLFLVGMLFPLMVEHLSYFSFLIFLVFCLNAGLFVWFNVPETKNRTVAEISAEFQRMHSKATLTMEATATSEPTQTMETTIATTDQQILSAEEDTIATKL